MTTEDYVEEGFNLQFHAAIGNRITEDREGGTYFVTPPDYVKSPETVWPYWDAIPAKVLEHIVPIGWCAGIYIEGHKHVGVAKTRQEAIMAAIISATRRAHYFL